jgi:hypothetical protein
MCSIWCLILPWVFYRFTEIADLRAIQRSRNEMVAAKKLMKAPTDAAMIQKGRAESAEGHKKRKGSAPGGEHALPL